MMDVWENEEIFPVKPWEKSGARGGSPLGRPGPRAALVLRRPSARCSPLLIGGHRADRPHRALREQGPVTGAQLPLGGWPPGPP